jgi:hypothetical protein
MNNKSFLFLSFFLIINNFGVVQASDYQKSSNFDWLSYLNSAWQSPYRNYALGSAMGLAVMVAVAHQVKQWLHKRQLELRRKEKIEKRISGIDQQSFNDDDWQTHLKNYNTKKRFITNNLNDIIFSCAYNQGNNNYMEDFGLAIEEEEDNKIFVGIFDGHGGTYVAGNLVHSDFVNNLLRDFSDSDDNDLIYSVIH